MGIKDLVDEFYDSSLMYLFAVAVPVGAPLPPAPGTRTELWALELRSALAVDAFESAQHIVEPNEILLWIWATPTIEVLETWSVGWDPAVSACYIVAKEVAERLTAGRHDVVFDRLRKVESEMLSVMTWELKRSNGLTEV
jgi:hypothetical protein